MISYTFFFLITTVIVNVGYGFVPSKKTLAGRDDHQPSSTITSIEVDILPAPVPLSPSSVFGKPITPGTAKVCLYFVPINAHYAMVVSFRNDIYKRAIFCAFVIVAVYDTMPTLTNFCFHSFMRRRIEKC